MYSVNSSRASEHCDKGFEFSILFLYMCRYFVKQSKSVKQFKLFLKENVNSFKLFYF